MRYMSRWPQYWGGSIPPWQQGQHGHWARAWNEGYAKVREDFTITEKAPNLAFFWLKVPSSNFTFKKLLRHYAKQVFTHFKQSWHWDPDAKMVGLVSIGAFSRDCEIFANRFKLYSVSLVSRNFSQISPLRVHRICRHVPAGRAAPCPAYDTMFGISQAGSQGSLRNTVDIIKTLWLQSHQYIYLVLNLEYEQQSL